MQLLRPQEQEECHQKKYDQHGDENCLRDVYRSDNPTSLLAKEDVTFFFSAMTWNVDLLEVLLAKAPNPMHNGIKPEEEKNTTTVVEPQPPLPTVAAFPSLEEALMEAATATTRSNGNSQSSNKNRKSGHYSRRSKRRKVRRARTIQLHLPFATSLSEEREYYGDEEDDCEEQEEMEAMKCHTHAPTTVLRDTCDVPPVKELYSTYTTEEEESDTGFAPHRCLEVRNTSLASLASAAVDVPLNRDTSKGDDVVSAEMTMPTKECLENNSMRDFLRQFYQSFLLVITAQVRQEQQNARITQSRYLSPLEYRAFCFVRRHMVAFKELLRCYVMCGEKEVERRGAQPLLVGRFDSELLEGVENLAPPHAQVYIAGKEPANQPLLLEFLHVTRVLQCYAEPQTLMGSHDTRSTRNATHTRNMASHALYYWRRLLVEGPNCCKSNNTGCNEMGITNLLFLSNEEWEFARNVFMSSLSPLVWTLYTTFGPYMVYTSQLPYTKQCITKLVIPAEDHSAYDLSAHFQEGVFHFLHGTPLFPTDDFSQDFGLEKQKFCRQSSLLHCSAGMHRSSGIAIAYLLWLIALSHGKLPVNITPCTALIKEKGEQQEKQQRQQNEEQRTTPSYLSAVLRNQKERQYPDCSLSAGAAVKPSEEEEEPRTITQDAAEEQSVVEEDVSVERCCMEHVRQQRSMALPIAAVQQQLLRYASHLHLH